MIGRALDVYWDNTKVGSLTQTVTGQLSFTYHENYLARKGRAISVSMPLQEAAYDDSKARPFFAGILPEEGVRTKLARYLGVSDKNPFALLEAVGGECAGALALYPAGEAPPSAEQRVVEPLDGATLQEVLAIIKRRPMMAGESDMRLSLAGAQNKLAVGYENGQVRLIKGNAPTTHILKPVIEGIHSSVFNEYFCMRLAKQVGLQAPAVYIHMAGDTPCYIVERYDRKRLPTGVVQRLHQEDFCQALSIPTECKYEREGGPSLGQCQELIKNCASSPALDLLRFLDVVIFNYLIGNADAHGKNFSWLYTEQRLSLAPCYDLLSTAVYPELASKMAMKIGGKYKPEDVFLRHWERLVPNAKTAQTSLAKKLKGLSAKTVRAAETLKAELHKEGLGHAVYDEILQVIQQRRERINSYF